MVFCTYCGQSFTRDEHLERHILTHTNIKPFKCLTCHMSFARRDLLQRHYLVHGKNQDNPEGMASMLVPKSAGRTPIACTNCAKTKTKCDKKFPCSRCASRNLKCILRPTRRVSRQPSTTQNLPVKAGEADCCSSGSSDSSQQSQIATPEGSKHGSPQPSVQLPLPSLDTSPPLKSVSALDQVSSSSPDKTFNFEHPQNASQKSIVFFSQSMPGDQSAHNMQPIISPMPSPGTIVNSFLSSNQIPTYDEFGMSPSDASDQSSPRFLMDWGQFQLPPQMNTMGRPDLAMSMGMSMNGMTTDTSMLAMMPEFVHSIASLQTPITTPRLSMCASVSDRDMRHGSISMSTGSRHGDFGYADLSAVIQGQDGWSCFRSAPTIPSSAVPKTARLHIEKLEQSLKNHELWNSWGLAWQDQDTTADHLAVVPVQECAKDKLLAITQSFLHKAIETHRGTSHLGPEAAGMSSYVYGSSFILLPPAQVLSYFLRSYANTFERYLPMSPCGVLDVNQKLMDRQGNDRATSILTLMMIAAGALYVPSMDARWLNGGLIEACRLSLFELVETNISMASDVTVSHAALLLTSTAAWSGDKWHMNIAMGQRGMYTSMLRHSGALEPHVTSHSPISSQEQLHADWQQRESTSRLVYSWAMLDQDLALFHDSPPLFSITELGTPLPDSDRLWHAKSTAEWTTVFGQVHEFSGGVSAAASGVRPVSLRSLFRHFMEDDIIPRGMELTPLQLRLLLHPLQALVCQYRQLTSCFSDNVSPRQQANNVHTQSMRARAEELQVLLKRWRRLADRYASSHPMCPLMQASMIVFHLISLNTVTNFPEIERLARREEFDGSYAQLTWKHKRCITDVEEAVYHCGQVLRLIKGMPANVRPPWWAGAVYRVGLVLWAESLAHAEDQSTNAAAASNNSVCNGIFTPRDQYIGVDAYTAEHPVLSRFRSKKEGRPALTRRDSSLVPVDNGIAILSHCLEIIDEGVANRFSDGIRNKLEKLARGL